MRPTVSICLPNLNTREFLPERFATIFGQSFSDWELLVYDSHSTDGAWEFIEQVARSDSRIRAWQGPREGTPGSWNPCIRQAVGEYVYIATSDDTMSADCLEKLVAALEAHPECDVAHCRLKAIDGFGREISGPSWSTSIFANSCGPLLDRRHVRKAPFDGLLHLLGGSVWVSITQLLIRRRLFDRIGLFESTWGSVGDFNWDMRAGLVANVVHVPDAWGGWRIHGGQATAGAALQSPEHAQRIEGMIADAIKMCGKFLTPQVRERLRTEWAPQAEEFRRFVRGKEELNGSAGRAFVVRQLLSGSGAARQHVKARLRGQGPWCVSFPGVVLGWLKEADMGPILIPDHASLELKAFLEHRAL